MIISFSANFTNAKKLRNHEPKIALVRKKKNKNESKIILVGKKKSKKPANDATLLLGFGFRFQPVITGSQIAQLASDDVKLANAAKTTMKSISNIIDIANMSDIPQSYKDTLTKIQNSVNTYSNEAAQMILDNKRQYINRINEMLNQDNGQLKKILLINQLQNLIQFEFEYRAIKINYQNIRFVFGLTAFCNALAIVQFTKLFDMGFFLGTSVGLNFYFNFNKCILMFTITFRKFFNPLDYFKNPLLNQIEQAKSIADQLSGVDPDFVITGNNNTSPSFTISLLFPVK